MIKRVVLLCSMCFLAVACSDDGGDDTPDAGDNTPDAAEELANPGFITPDVITTAWTNENGAWIEVGPADFSCLNTPTPDTPTTVDINLSGEISDFQNGTPVANASVEMFAGVDTGNVLVSTTGDGDGNYALVLPQGETRYGYRISADDYLDTFLLNQYFTPDNDTQTRGVDAISVLTADLLPAIIGISRTSGLGVVAAAVRDCNGDTIKSGIATMSATSGTADHLTGGQTYYFSSGLPTNLTVMQQTNSDGLFVVLELPETANGYLQVWGFTEGQDPATDELTLLAEIPAPVVGDTVISASLEPLRQ